MKPRLVLTLAVLVAAVAFSSWFLYKDEIKHAIQPEDSHIPDYTLDNFVYDSYTPQGKLDYRILGVYMEHLPEGDNFHVTGLNYSAYHHGKVDWTAEAETAKLQGKTQILDLKSKVKISYFSSKEKQPILMQTEAMTIHTKRNYAENKHATYFLFSGGNFQSKGGFQLDGKKRTLKMFGGVSGEIRHE